MYTEQLIKLGFTRGEAKTYLAALELGETSVARIAKKASLERTTVYGFLDTLKKRGLVTISKRGKRTVYIAENPKKLKSELEEKGRSIDILLPGLLSITNAIDNKPSIQYFDTKEGIYDIYRETLQYPSKPIIMWMSDPWFDNERFWKDFFLPSRIEKKILLKAIIPKTEENISFVKDDLKSLRETRMTEGKEITSEIMLYGNRKIAIISYEESTGLVIESKKLFETLSAVFNAHWESLGDSKS